jgi:multidrug resistance efflux pump
MRKGPIIAVVILGGILAGGYFVDRARAAQQSVLSGFFESQPTLSSSRIGGRVEKILVKEGDAIKQGQPLIRFEADSYKASVEASRSAEESAAQQYLETVRGSRPEDIARQREIYEEAEADYQKLVNGPLPEEIRQARDKLRETQAEDSKAVRGSRPEEIAQADAAAGEALAKLQQSERGLTVEERAELKARLDSATAAQALAQKDLDRAQVLYNQGAISRQQYDTQVSTTEQAKASVNDAAETYKRAQEGTPKEELDQARKAYEQAKAQQELVRRGNRWEDVEAARQEMKSAQESLNLLLRGSRKEDIDAARAHADSERAYLTELEHGNRKEDIAKAKAGQEQAANEAKSTEQNLKEQVLYAPFDGIVDRVLIADGDLIAPNQSVLQLSNPADIWLRVYLPEDQLPKVHIGDDADLSFDGISGLVKGKVESIDKSGQFTPANLQSPDERAKQVFGIRIRLAQPDSRVKAGMYSTVKRMGAWP